MLRAFSGDVRPEATGYISSIADGCCGGATAVFGSGLDPLKRLLGTPESIRFGTLGTGTRQGQVLVVLRVPGRAAPHHALRDTAPLRDLAVVGAHPVHRNWCQAPLFPIPSEAQPTRAELRRHSSSGTGIGAPVAEHAFLDQVNRVLHGRSPLHLAPFDGRGMDHPDLPALSPGVQKGAIAGVF